MSATEEREARASRVVCGWLRAQLAFHDLDGFLIVDAETPEARLLTRWLDDADLAYTGAPGGPSPAHAVADARMHHPTLLPVVSIHKSGVLLDGAPRCLAPLGDLWAEDIHSWIGGCSLPQGIADSATLFSIEAAIRHGLAHDALRKSLNAVQPDGSPDLETRMRRVAAFNRGPGIPKLEAFTVGMDLLLS